MLQFKQVNISVDGRVLVSANDLLLEKGPIALVGRNGAGKSTLLRSIMGMHMDFTGDILLTDKNTLNLSGAERSRLVSVVYSKSTVFGNHSGREVIMLGRLPYQNAFARETAVDKEIVDHVIGKLGINSFVDRAFSQLSDGEKQLVMIGRAMAQDTKIILLDEPGAFLDLVNRHRLIKVLEDISHESGKLVLFSTHEVGFLPGACDSVLLIENGILKHLSNKETFLKEIGDSFGIPIE